MPWRGPEKPRELPTLANGVADFIEANCAISDGDRVGEPFILTEEQLLFLAQFYALDPATGRFVFERGAQLVRPHKWGKGPFSAAIICAEAAGPVLFDGWDAAGEPVGRPWATPHIQVTAASEDQVANVFRALLPMIELGSLRADIPDTGKTRVNLPGGGLIEPVTSSAISRLGQRITFIVQDQTESWTVQNRGRELADNQRRGLAAMGGRFLETANAFDPLDESVAQYTSEVEARTGDVYIDDVDPGPGSVRNKAERLKMLRVVYGDSARRPRKNYEYRPWEPWVDLHRIDAEIAALVDRDPAQAERWFLNRKIATESAAFDADRWDQLMTDEQPAARARIVVGVDGARFVDALAMVATEVETGHQWPLGIWERPESAGDDYEHPDDEIDGALLEAFETYDVWRTYVDPQWIDHLLDRWQGRWGEKRVVPWYTNRGRQVAWAVRSFSAAILSGDMSHNGDEVLSRHVKNARRQKIGVYDDQHRQMHTISKDRPSSPRKIDGAMAAVISWEARGDCIADGPPPAQRSRVPIFS